jgi:hypothetical protein
MGGKNTATKSNGGLKIVDLGNELRVDPRQIVAAAKEMAMENAKVPASWVSAGQADRLRAKFGGQGELKAKIERKLRHFESALETPTEVPKVESIVKSQSPKFGKRTFEADRRAIFGVVRTDAPEPLKSAAVSKSAESAASALASSDTPAAVTESASTPPTLPTNKKFIGVTVAPPIRREPNSPDPRFGVIVPSPENEKKETGSAIWSNLNDGHEPVDFSTPGTDAKKSIEAPEAEEIEEAVEIFEEPNTKAPKHSSRKAHAETASVDMAPLTVVPHVNVQPALPEESMRKHNLDVPVKWQPKNKAFGSKGKHKTKLLKKLETREPEHTTSHKAKPEKAIKRETQHDAKRHSPSAEAKAPEAKRQSERKPVQTHEKSEGVLKRLMRKIFK